MTIWFESMLYFPCRCGGGRVPGEADGQHVHRLRPRHHGASGGGSCGGSAAPTLMLNATEAHPALCLWLWSEQGAIPSSCPADLHCRRRSSVRACWRCPTPSASLAGEHPGRAEVCASCATTGALPLRAAWELPHVEEFTCLPAPWLHRVAGPFCLVLFALLTLYTSQLL